MKKLSVMLLSLMLFCQGCSLDTYFVIQMFKSKITVADAMKIKDDIDMAVNPAKKSELLAALKKKMIKIDNVKVKRVINSSNIDYEFCVVVEAEYEKGQVECYIYSREVSTIAEIEAGLTSINCVGDFSKFFTSVEDAFLKIEMTNSNISILQ
ncbi:MAG TPA: hypothetical protein PK624_08805 [Spirochaetota bacterium]|nr:hypothetical protein [Spirochaetota bacterium]HOR44880.1 hypothetical protein [Spirochaetota bacterium]HPK55537.1 hypothetical protein [Spirochaetota bacterium]